MTKLGKKLVAAANKGIANYAQRKADPAGYRLHVPRKIDVRAMRRTIGMTQETFGLRCGLTLVALVLVVLALVVALAILALVTLTLLVLALLVLVRGARASGRRAASVGRGRFSRRNHSLFDARRASGHADRYKKQLGAFAHRLGWM